MIWASASSGMKKMASCRMGVRLMLVALLLFQAADGWAAPTTAPAARAGSVEAMPLRRAAAASSPASSAAKSDQSSNTLGYFRVISALAIVLAMIFALKWASKRFLGIQTPGASSGAIRILSRQIISPRQQLMLVQVGQRILLVANCGAQMNSLCEMSDADEVAAILTQVKQKPASPAGKPFASLFQRAEADYDAEQPAESDKEKLDPGLATTREELGGLLNKVKAISRSFRKS